VEPVTPDHVDVGRVAEQAKAWDPARLVDNQSGLNLGADGDIMDEHWRSGRRSRTSRVS
jgi:hypothetical protein